MKLTGGQVIATALKKYGIKYVAAIPGHGCWAMLDAFLQKGSEIPVIQVMHEQCAVHMADGYWRASGKPMAAMTSIGPGAANTIIGLATAYADSTAVPLFTGGPATHMRGHGVMQELDRHRTNFFPQIASGAVKRSFEAGRVDELPFIMHRAFNAMLSGHPGPVHVEVPMDIQSEAAEVDIHDVDLRMAMGRARPDQRAVEAAATALLSAERPVIVVGGGAITAEAAPEVRKLAEKTGAVVVTTWNGKSAFPEGHVLYAGAVGQTGTSAGNNIAAGADLIVSVGCRFTDRRPVGAKASVSLSRRRSLSISTSTIRRLARTARRRSDLLPTPRWRLPISSMPFRPSSQTRHLPGGKHSTTRSLVRRLIGKRSSPHVATATSSLSRCSVR
ncbi:thiamine pyrophosphate-binding protein [Mesorhizobium sp. M1182]|uniref:thiamine pyrophosphate-binding protein n=1 Tax=unclassified Mesorhizobium TaxID=325217 RepID=UPI00333C5E94